MPRYSRLPPSPVSMSQSDALTYRHPLMSNPSLFCPNKPFINTMASHPVFTPPTICARSPAAEPGDRKHHARNRQR